jgi:predicted peptidase
VGKRIIKNLKDYMKKIRLILFQLTLFLLVSVAAFGQMTRTDHVFGTIPYSKYIPSDLEAHPIKGVIIFLHGNGQRGTDLDVLEQEPIPELFKSPSVVTKDYVIICPQLPVESSSWSATNLKYLLELCAKTKLEYDTDILICTGLSLGGFTSLNLMKEAYTKYGNNTFFTAVGLMCAKENTSLTAPFTGVPIKLWHGTTDTTNPISNMRAFTTRVNAAGGNVTLVEYAGVGHDVWSLPRGYADANFWAFADTYGEVQSNDCTDEVAAATTAGYNTGYAAGVTAGTVIGRTQMKALAVAAIAALTP